MSSRQLRRRTIGPGRGEGRALRFVPGEVSGGPIAKLESRGSRGFREYPRGCRPSTTTRKPGLRLVFIKTMGLEMLKNPG